MAFITLKPNSVWFSEYRPDKVRIKASVNFSGVYINDYTAEQQLVNCTVEDSANEYIRDEWHEFYLHYSSDSKSGDINELVIVTNETDGYVYGLEFGPQTPIEHPEVWYNYTQDSGLNGQDGTTYYDDGNGTSGWTFATMS